MNLAIYGGSFDPPHKGHVAIIEEALATLDIDLLIIVVAYQNPFKSRYRSSATKRLEWIRTITQKYEKVVCSDYEILQNRPVPTIESVRYFQQHYQPSKMYLLLGQDNFLQLHKWHCFESLRQLLCFVVFERVLDSMSDSYNNTSCCTSDSRKFKTLSPRTSITLPITTQRLRRKIAKALNLSHAKAYNPKMPIQLHNNNILRMQGLSYTPHIKTSKGKNGIALRVSNLSYTLNTTRNIPSTYNQAICGQFARRHGVNARYLPFCYPYSSSLITRDIARYYAEIPESIRNKVVLDTRQLSKGYNWVVSDELKKTNQHFPRNAYKLKSP